MNTIFLKPNAETVIKQLTTNPVVYDEHGMEIEVDGYIILNSGYVCPLRKGALQMCQPIYAVGERLVVYDDLDMGTPLYCPRDIDEFKDNVKSHNDVLDDYMQRGLPQDKAKAKNGMIVSFKLF